VKRPRSDPEILLVAHDAMTTDRPYRAAMMPVAALTELRTWSANQFERNGS
jgi:HD-GYP domain-containing protein (c-di-GMP phosphodiesterase class II)